MGLQNILDEYLCKELIVLIRCTTKGDNILPQIFYSILLLETVVVGI